VSEKNDSNQDGDNSKSGQNNGPLVYLRGVFVAGTWAFIGLLLTALFWPNLTERTKFFTGNFLNLLIVFAIISQIVIYRKQWRVMERQSRLMDESLNETRKIIAQNEKFNRINSRAYVFIDTARLDAPINSGKYPLPNIVVKNSGKSPAFNHRMRIEQAFLVGDALKKAKKGIMPKMRPLNKKGLAIIGAGHSTHLHLVRGAWKTSEDEELAIKGEAVFYMWGLNVYEDIFGQEHFSRFSLYARNPRVTNLSFGWYGNDVEYDGSDYEEPN
jgi:hypothetical protein